VAFAAAFVTMSTIALGACRSPARRHGGGADNGDAPKDEIWLSDDDLRRLHVTTEEVKLEAVDETLVTVGPVVGAADCPARTSPEERKACAVVAVDQASLGRIHVGSAVTGRTSELVHDTFPGQIAWVAGALDSSGRTVKVACLLPDPMAELRPGRQVRVEVVVGAKPEFAVSRGAVLETGDGAFVFAAGGTTDDGRHKFARVSVRPGNDTGGPWLPVANLQPGSFVVRTGTEALASMLTVTAL